MSKIYAVGEQDRTLRRRAAREQLCVVVWSDAQVCIDRATDQTRQIGFWRNILSTES